MRKCPRCGHELKENENFCSHCGLDLRQGYPNKKPNNKAMTYLLYVIIFFSFITIPLLYSRVLNQMVNREPMQQETKIELPDVVDSEATALIGSYETLADFQNQFTNVDSIVEDIENYEKTLSQKNGTWEKEYQIQIADNYNIYYDLTYRLAINDDFSIEIQRSYDRAHTYNDETVVFVKNHATTFDELFFTEEQQQIIQTYTGNQTTTTQLMNDFKERKDEFEQKKKTLGHYGMGNYDGQSSFVVYRQDQTYYSKLTYTHTPQDYIS